MTYIMMLIILIPTVFITAITPYITRRTESFGVSIPEEIYGNPELAQFRKKYAYRTGILGAGWLALSMLAGMLYEENIGRLFL